MKNSLLNILYSDDHIVVVNKPSGLLSIPDRFDATLPSVKSLIREKFGSVFVVHRLDAPTSGVMVFALDAESHRDLSMQFEHHTVRKSYLAVLSGVMTQDTVKVDIPIIADTRRKGLMRPSARGKEAHTILTVEQRFRVATLVRCELITGRQHQIRVHCSSIGHPLLVDPDYGKSASFMLSSIKRKFNLAKRTEERPIIERLTLHSQTLAFKHPATGVDVNFEAPMQRDFAALLQILSKYSAPFETPFGDDLLIPFA